MRMGSVIKDASFSISKPADDRWWRCQSSSRMMHNCGEEAVAPKLEEAAYVRVTAKGDEGAQGG
jgi:hypothetical protein